LDDRRRDGGTNCTLRTKEQGTHLTLNEHDDDDDDDDDDGFLLLRNRQRSAKQRLGCGVDNQNSISVRGRKHRVSAGSKTHTALWRKLPAGIFSEVRFGQVFCTARAQRPP